MDKQTNNINLHNMEIDNVYESDLFYRPLQKQQIMMLDNFL